MTMQPIPEPVWIRRPSVSTLIAPLIGVAVVLGMIAGGASTAAPSPVMVKDINVTSSPYGTDWLNHGRIWPDLYRVGQQVFFVGTDTTHGSELWRSDGTPEGTGLVKDLSPGNKLQGIRLVGQTNNVLIFAVAGGLSPGLWRSDGTAKGTYHLTRASGESYMSGGLFWFTTSADVANGIAGGPWRSDGTIEGTYALQEPEEGSLGAMLSNVTLPGPFIFSGKKIADIGGEVYFFGSDRRVVKSGGSPESTQDLGVLPEELPTVVGLRSSSTWASVFTAISTHQFGWWAFHGSMESLVNLAEGVEAMGAVSAGSIDDFHLAALQDFHGTWRIWRSDGTPAGTVALKALPRSSNWTTPSGFVEHGGKIYFWTDGDRSGREPWVTDGTPEGTFMLKDINRGSSSSSPSSFQIHGDAVYFTASDGKKRRMWKSDGTSKGTVATNAIPKEAKVGNSSFAILDGTFFYTTFQDDGIALWKSDGTLRGSSEVARVGGSPGDSRFDEGKPEEQIHAVGDSVVFRASDGKSSVLWKSDGTEVGTFPLEFKWKTHIDGWGARSVTVRGDQILFVNAEGGKRRRSTLYTSDGSALSAGLIPGIPSKTYPTGITNMVSADGWSYFHTETHLWATQGDANSTFQLVDIGELGTKIVSASLFATSHEILFVTEDRSLWKASAADRTVEKVKDSGASWVYPSNLQQLGSGTLLFTIKITGGFEIWRSNGTEQGTSKVITIPTASDPQGFTVSGDRMWFQLPASSDGIQLWRCDGTEAGTFAVETQPNGFGSLGAGPDGTLFFRVWDGGEKYELWTSDGSVEGTRQVKDLVEYGDGPSVPAHFARVGDHVYFSAQDPVHGRELWKSDGTEAGTVMVADLTGDSGSSSPSYLTLAGNKLFFEATTEEAGREIHVLDVSADLAGSP
jgi:ELWxxDGT repeat protein